MLNHFGRFLSMSMKSSGSAGRPYLASRSLWAVSSLKAIIPSSVAFRPPSARAGVGGSLSVERAAAGLQTLSAFA